MPSVGDCIKTISDLYSGYLYIIMESFMLSSAIHCKKPKELEGIM